MKKFVKSMKILSFFNQTCYSNYRKYMDRKIKNNEKRGYIH